MVNPQLPIRHLTDVPSPEGCPRLRNGPRNNTPHVPTEEVPDTYMHDPS